MKKLLFSLAVTIPMLCAVGAKKEGNVYIAKLRQPQTRLYFNENGDKKPIIQGREEIGVGDRITIVKAGRQLVEIKYKKGNASEETRYLVRHPKNACYKNLFRQRLNSEEFFERGE